MTYIDLYIIFMYLRVSEKKTMDGIFLSLLMYKNVEEKLEVK